MRKTKRNKVTASSLSVIDTSQGHVIKSAHSYTLSYVFR